MGFGLGIVALSVWLGVMFTVMRESDEFTEFMNNLPTGLLSAFGIDSATFLTAGGFLSSYLFTLFAPLFVLFFIISAAVNEVMAEERDGLLDMVLSTPVSRTRVFLEKTGGVALGGPGAGCDPDRCSPGREPDLRPVPLRDRGGVRRSVPVVCWASCSQR